MLMWSLFFAVVAFVLIASLLSQRQTSSGGGTEIVKIKSLTCKTDNYLYPFLKFDESDKKELKIVATFGENDLKSISLQQTLYYNDVNLVSQSEGENHAAMNVGFAENGLGADALGANYAKLSNAMVFGLYAVGDEMNETAMKYFLLDGAKKKDENDVGVETGGGNEANGIDKTVVKDYNETKQIYEELGMSCVGENE